jgi:hypothetical protein
LVILNFFEISDKEKELIVQGLIENTIKFMTDCIDRQTSKKRAKRFTKPHYQSTTSISKDTLQYNILIKKQTLPARPIDFRLKLANEEKQIGMSEMTDILSSSPFLGNLLERHNEKYPFRRGRPNSNLAEERRGKPVYYADSDIQKIFDSIIKDSKLLKQIDDIVTNHEIFPLFLNYSFEVYFKEMKEDETAFKNSYKPLIQNHKLQSFEKNKIDNNQWILAKDLDKNKIKELSQKYTHVYKTNLNRQLLNIIYMAGLSMYLESIRISQQD